MRIDNLEQSIKDQYKSVEEMADADFKEQQEVSKAKKQTEEAKKTEAENKIRAEKVKNRKKSILSKIAGNKLNEVRLQTSLKGLDGKRSDEVLAFLQENDGKNSLLNHNTYIKLVKALKSKDVRDIDNILSKKDDKNTHKLSEEEIAIKERSSDNHTLVKVLSEQTSATLEGQIASKKRELRKFEEIESTSVSKNFDEELQKALLERELEMYSRALLKRDLDNFKLFLKAENHGNIESELRKISQAHTGEKKSEIDKSIESIRILRKSLDGDAISFGQIRDELESARVFFDRHFETSEEIEHSELLKEKIDLATLAKDQKILIETISVAPTLYFNSLRRKVESGADGSLEKYISELKNENGQKILNKVGIPFDAKVSKYDYRGKSISKTRIAELLNMNDLDEEDRLELFTLISSLGTELDTQEILLTLESDEARTKYFDSTDDKARKKIKELLKIDKDLNESNFKEKIEVLWKRISNEENLGESSLTSLTEALSAAREMVDVDFQHMIDWQSNESVAQTVRQTLILDIMHQGRLDMDMIRTHFNRYDFPGLNLHDAEGKAEKYLLTELKNNFTEFGEDFWDAIIERHDDFYKHKEVDDQGYYFSNDRNAEGLDEKKWEFIKKVLLSAREDGPMGLQALVDEMKDSGEVPEGIDAKKLIEFVEAQMTFPYEYSGKDANGNTIFTANQHNKLLYQEMIAFMKVDKKVEGYWKENMDTNIDDNVRQKEQAKQPLQNRILANILLQNALIRDPNNSRNIKSKFANLDFDTDSKTLLGNIKNMLGEQKNVVGGKTIIQQIDELSNWVSDEKRSKNPLNELFILEKGPGGFIARVQNQELMQYLLGLDPQYFNNAQGVTFNEENTVGDIPGYIAIVNNLSESHEKLHIIEQSILSIAKEQNGSALERENYYKLGLDEIVANLIGPNREEALKNMNSLEQMGIYLPENILNNLKTTDDLTRHLKESLNEDHQKAFVILNLVKEILLHPEIEENEMYHDEAREQILSLLTEYSSNPDTIIEELFYGFGMIDIAGKNIADRRLYSQGPEKDKLHQALFNKYLGGDFDVNIEATSIKTNIYSGQQITDDEETNQKSFDEFIESQRQNQKVNGILKFFRFGTSNQNVQDYGAGVADNLGFKDVYGNFRDGYKRELYRKFGTMDTLPWNDHPSVFEERRTLRIVHLPGAKYAPVKVVEGMLNGVIDKAVIRTLYPLNTRDFSMAWAGTPLGNYLNLSKFRGSSPNRRRGYIHPIAFLFGKNYEEWFGRNKAGIQAKGRIEGHVNPDYIRSLTTNDKHFAILQTSQDVLSKDISGSQTLSLMEKIHMATINAIPGDRPQFNPGINSQRAGEISDLSLQRMRATAFNFHETPREQIALSSYGEFFNFGLSEKNPNNPINGSSVVITDGNGTLYIKSINKDPNGQEIVTLTPLSENVLEGMFSKKIMDTKGTFYNSWRPDMVKYDNEIYYVHYNPKTGMPGLYKDDWINWSSNNIPEPLKTIVDEKEVLVEPRFCEYMQKRDYPSERHRMDMNIGAIGLFNQIMNAREEQKKYYEEKGIPYNERDLYSFHELIESVKQYEDPYGGLTGADPTRGTSRNEGEKFVREVELPYFDGVGDNPKKQRQIVIPHPSGNPELAQIVDFEVALELIARVEKFEVLDNITRQAFVKGNPEVYVRNPEVYGEPKFRDMAREYIVRLADPDMTYFNHEIVSNPQGGNLGANQVKRFDMASLQNPQFSQLTQEQQNYSMTPEGTAKRLQALKLAQENSATPADYDEEISKVETRLRKFVEFDEIESILYEGQYGLFENKPLEERIARRQQMRQGLENLMQMTDANGDTVMDLARQTIENRMLPGLRALHQGQGLSDAQIISLHESEINRGISEFIFADKTESAGGSPFSRQLSEVSLGAHVINKFFGTEKDLLAPNAIFFVGDKAGNDITVTNNMDAEVNNNLSAPFKDLYNYGNFDKRPLERLLSHKSKEDILKIRHDLMSNMQDKDKYRQEMKDWTIKVMMLADFHANEFNRYRRAKYFWDAMAKNVRRYNTIAFMGLAAAMFLTTSPIILPSLLASIGVSKTLLPFLDMRHAVSVNRRNYARELSRKIRAESNRIIEMFERGQTLNQNMRDDLEDLDLEYNILGESIQGRFKPEGWKPNKNFLIDFLTDSLMNEQNGLVPKALAS